MTNAPDLPPPHPGLLRGVARGLLERLFRLAGAARAPHTPLRLRVAAWLALAYLLFPFDLVSDLLPLLGFGDDLLALSLLGWSLSRHVTPDIRHRARAHALRIIP